MRCLGVLCCLLCVESVLAGGWRTNMAANPSFERDDNQDGSADGWRGSPYKSPAKVAWDRDVGHHGRASVRIADPANPGRTAWDEVSGRWTSAARWKVTAGKSYALGVWVKTKNVTGSASACIAWWNGSAWLAENYTPKVTGTVGWRHVAVTAHAPPNADGAMVYLCHSRGTGTAWFDDVCFTPGRAAAGRMAPLDISSLCNGGLVDRDAGDAKGGPTNPGRDGLRLIPSGSVVLRGVPFDIVDPSRTKRRWCVVLRGKDSGRPAGVTIPVGRTCRTLYFLHASGRAKAGKDCGRYELLYDDDTKAVVQLACGKQIFDRRRPAESAEVAVGWQGAHASGKNGRVGLGIFPLTNPSPGKRIRSVRVLAADGAAELILAGLTTSDASPLLTAKTPPYEYTDKTGWYTWDFPLNDTNLDSIDLTQFLDAPAGKHGFLSVRKDGHFYFADGTRARFFGTNMCGPRCFPAKADAPGIAARLAKYGMNMLRIHAIDGKWGGLFDFSRGDSRHIDPAKMDRLDFFVAELKKRGIYMYFDLLDYRRFLPGDGVKDAAQFQHGWSNSIKGATIFNDRLIELQKEFATQFLTHRNPYTQMRYVDDPALAVVETTNENSVFYMHNTALTLPVYTSELRRRWHAWLREKYTNRAGLAKAWTNDRRQCALLAGEDPGQDTVHLPLRHIYQDPAKAGWIGHRSPARVSDMLRFLVAIERRYYKQLHAHLRKIGLRVPITGTNQTFCPASTYADAAADFMTRNNYWCHPAVRARPHVRFRNLSVIGSNPDRTSNPITNVASSTVAGKPMIVPEFNFPWPNEFRAECLPLMTAYALLQDWDGLLFFAYNADSHRLEHFSNQSDPVRWGQVPAAALMWYRRDVSVAKHTVEVAWSEADIFAGRPTHARAPTSPFRYLPYVCKVRNRFPGIERVGPVDVRVAASPETGRTGQSRHVFQGEGIASWNGAAFSRQMRRWKLLPADAAAAGGGRALASDTGQMSLETSAGTFTIATPRTVALVGRLAGRGPATVGGVSIDCRMPFAAIMLTSLDGRPLVAARRILLTAVSRAENTGQTFLDNKRAIPDFGRPPVQTEPVEAAVTLTGKAGAVAYALDVTGRRERKLAVKRQRDAVVIETAGARSPWIEIIIP